MKIAQLVGLLLVTVLVGCGGGGPSLVSGVGGTVNMDGKPLESASVAFVYDDGTRAVGMTGADGKFTLTTGGRSGAPAGVAKVAIVKVDDKDQPDFEDTGSMDPEEMTQFMAKMTSEKAKEEVEEVKILIPTKYNDPDASGFTADVVSGQDNSTFVFDLKS